MGESKYLKKVGYIYRCKYFPIYTQRSSLLCTRIPGFLKFFFNMSNLGLESSKQLLSDYLITYLKTFADYLIK